MNNTNSGPNNNPNNNSIVTSVARVRNIVKEECPYITYNIINNQNTMNNLMAKSEDEVRKWAREWLKNSISIPALKKLIRLNGELRNFNNTDKRNLARLFGLRLKPSQMSGPVAQTQMKRKLGNKIFTNANKLFIFLKQKKISNNANTRKMMQATKLRDERGYGGGKKKKPVKKKPTKKKPAKRKPTGKKKVRKIHRGPKGGKYYISKGRKVYI